MRHPSSIGGAFSDGFGPRRLIRRAGVLLAGLALALQCLVVALHQPARAAALPFQDPAAWCVSGADHVPDHDKAPLHAGLVCPICQSLQAAGLGLVPPPVVLAPPSIVQVAAGLPADITAPRKHGRIFANPRAPPQSL